MDQTSPTAQTEPTKKSGAISQALGSASFIEKAVLLVLTAVTSGVLIPYIGDKMQAAKTQNQALTQAKAKLLDDVTSTIITYEYLAGDVSYYKADSAVANDKMQAMAFERYSNKVTDLMAQWGVEIARAKTLVSPEISDKLEKFMDKVLTEQEPKLVALYNNNAPVEEWSRMNDLTGVMYEEAKKLIAELAVDLQLNNTAIKTK
ncbi:MAG: hypothetical protein ACKOU7_07820 [Ferruginibacter sp.]